MFTRTKWKNKAAKGITFLLARSPNIFPGDVLNLLPVRMSDCFTRLHELIVAGIKTQFLNRLGQCWNRPDILAITDIQFLEQREVLHVAR